MLYAVLICQVPGVDAYEHTNPPVVAIACCIGAVLSRVPVCVVPGSLVDGVLVVDEVARAGLSQSGVVCFVHAVPRTSRKDNAMMICFITFLFFCIVIVIVCDGGIVCVAFHVLYQLHLHDAGEHREIRKEKN